MSSNDSRTSGSATCGGALLPSTIEGFLSGIRFTFQRDQSAGLDAVFHFTFTGSDSTRATVTIRDKALDVQAGLLGTADCAVTADAATWLGFLRKEKSIVWALIRRKVRVAGKLGLLTAFGKCFPT